MAFRSQRVVPGSDGGSFRERTQLENALGERQQYSAACCLLSNRGVSCWLETSSAFSTAEFGTEPAAMSAWLARAFILASFGVKIEPLVSSRGSKSTDNNRVKKMSKTVDRKKSFESNFADEVRRLVSVRKRVIEVAEFAVRQESSTKNRSIADSILKAAMALNALTLGAVDPADRLLGDVFAFCALDPMNPWHWRILLEATIEVTFKKSGAREKWGEGALFELMIDVRELKRIDPSATTEKKVAELRKKKEPFKSKYVMKLGYLRKLVGKAENPRFNPSADYKEDTNFLEFLTQRRREQSGLSAEVVSSLMEKFTEDQIEASLADLKRRWEEQGKTWTDATREALLPEVSKIIREHLAKPIK
jgi:hypothetical protein